MRDIFVERITEKPGADDGWAASFTEALRCASISVSVEMIDGYAIVFCQRRVKL